MDQNRLEGRVKRMEQQDDRIRLESVQLSDVFERLRYLEGVHDSQTHK